MKQLVSVLSWIVANFAALSAIGSALVAIGYKVHKTWPSLPAGSPRLVALQELGSAVWPDVQRASRAAWTLITGKQPPSGGLQSDLVGIYSYAEKPGQVLPIDPKKQIIITSEVFNPPKPKVPPLPVLLCLALLVSCGGVQHTPAQVARIGVEGSAHIVDAAASAVAVAIRHDRAAGMPQATILARWTPVDNELYATRAALIVAETLVDAYNATHGSACLAHDALVIASAHVTELTRLLTAVGVPATLEPMATQVIAGATQLAPACHDGGL